MTKDADLQRALNHLYAVFSVYSLPEQIDMSPYRDPEREVGAMRRKPLRELEADDLDSYASHALSTVGDLDLFKYALPRLLAFTSQGALLTDQEIVLGKLAYGEWETWPDREQQAIREFLWAWWVQTLHTFRDTIDRIAETVLASIAQVVSDLSPYLAEWEADDAPPATDHVAQILDFAFDEESGALRLNPFWNEHPRQSLQVKRWLIRPLIEKRLLQGRANARERDAGDELLDVYERALYAIRQLIEQKE